MNNKIIYYVTAIFIACNVIDMKGDIGLKWPSFILLFILLVLNIKKIKINKYEIGFFLFLLFFYCLSLIITLINLGDISLGITYNNFMIVLVMFILFSNLFDPIKIFKTAMYILFYSSFIVFISNILMLAGIDNQITAFFQSFAMNYDSYVGERSENIAFVAKIYYQFTLFLPASFIYFLFNEHRLKAGFIFIAILFSVSRGATIIAFIFFLIYLFRDRSFKQISINLIYTILLLLLSYFFILNFIPRLYEHFLLLQDASSYTVYTRLDQFDVIITSFEKDLSSFLFGFGAGTGFYSEFLDEQIYNVEIAILEFFRKYGLFFTLGIIYLFYKIIKPLYQSEYKIVSFCLFALFIATFTNPVLTSPLFLLLFVIGYRLKYN